MGVWCFLAVRRRPYTHALRGGRSIERIAQQHMGMQHICFMASSTFVVAAKIDASPGSVNTILFGTARDGAAHPHP